MEPSVLSADVDSAVVERRRRRPRDVRVAPPQRTRALVQRNEPGPRRQIDGPMGEGRGRGDLVRAGVVRPGDVRRDGSGTRRGAASTGAFHSVAPADIERSAHTIRPVPKSTMTLTASGPFPEATEDPKADAARIAARTAVGIHRT